jgi:hypothetical protein
MNKVARLLVGSSLMLACSCMTVAQEKPLGNQSVLQITREYTKPGKAGMAHDVTESSFVQAMARAKWPTHYLGMTSLSGQERALFLTWYPSFDAWEKDSNAVDKSTELSAALDRASVADGELLSSVDQSVFVFRDELSLRSMSVADLSPMRYMEISVYHVRPGHDAEWNEAVKMVKAAYEKAVPSAHWGMYEQVFGGDGGTYVVFTARKTLGEIDRAFLEDKQFDAAMGEDGMKKLEGLVSAAIESSQHQLFQFNAHMSYVADEWIKADPSFWKP